MIYIPCRQNKGMDNMPNLSSDPSTLLSAIRSGLARSGVDTQELARQLGYENPRVVEMLVSGTVRVPLYKVVPFARTLGLDPGQLLREWFATYCPEAFLDIEPFIALSPREPHSEGVRTTTEGKHS